MSDSVVKNDAHVIEILESYLAALEAGDAPDRETLLAQHPEIADALGSALRGLDFVHQATRNLSRTYEEGEATPGKTLGDYRILREVGRGGMAVVYEAEQVSLARRVALKVLPFAAVLDSKQLQRFRNEAQAAAHLHHPHIVPVHAVGSERGVHYYAMQYIDGRSLAIAIREMVEVCRSIDNRKPECAAGGSRTPLSSHDSNRDPGYLRMAASLGVQAAEALDHAHQFGIVHRDVKPGNLLLDEAGALWITDFGLARSRNDVQLTITGEIVGTIRYMSPEQALAKRTPVDHRTDVYSLGATLYELFTLRPAFPGEDPHQVIQDIAIKEPTPPRHLNPAMPHDLENVLLKAMAKDPESRYATAQDLAEDLRRYLQNKPVLARRPSLAARAAKWSRRHRGLVAAILVVLLVGIAALAIGAARLASEEGKTTLALGQAETNLQLARQAVDQFLVDIGARGVPDGRLPKPARRRLLELALTFYETYLGAHNDARALVVKGDILLHLRLHEDALKSRERAIEVKRLCADALGLFDRACRINPSDPFAEAGRSLALLGMGRREDALAASDRAIGLNPKLALALSSRALALDSLGRRDEAVTAWERVSEVDAKAAPPHANRAGILLALGRLDEALSASDRAVQLDPADPFAHLNRGRALYGLQRREEAIAAFDRATELDPGFAFAHRARAIDLADLGRYEEALAAVERAIETDPNDDPEVSEWGSAGDNAERGWLLAQLGRPEEALAACDRAIEIDPKFARAYQNRAGALQQLGRPEEALAACDRAVELRQDDASTHADRAASLVALGRFPEALDACDRAIQLEPNLARAHLIRSGALAALGRFDEAIVACDRVTAIEPTKASAFLSRGVTLVSLGRLQDALAAFRRAIELDPKDPRPLAARAKALVSLGRREEALEDCDRAVELAPQDAVAHCDRGGVLLELCRFPEALEACDRAVELDGRLAGAHCNRAAALLRMGSFKEALAACDLAVKLDPELALAHCNRGSALQALGHPAAEVLAAYDRAVQLDPRLVVAHCNRGGALLDLGRLKEALDACDTAIELNPRLVLALDNRGRVLRALGHPEEALTSFNQAIDLDPNDAQIYVARSRALDDLGREAEALADLDRAIDLGHRPPSLLNEVAWRYATCADQRLRNVTRAVELARDAVTGAPAQGQAWNTLGVALCRAGKWQEALGAFEKSIALRDGGDAYDWFFVAMAQWHLDRKDQARAWYDKAVAWMDANRRDDEGLNRFREDTASLLGVK